MNPAVPAGITLERIRIAGGRVIDPASDTDRVCDVFVADGRVAGIGDAPSGFSPDQVINASGQVVCPGLVDLMARMREPGSEQKGSIASETAAAAAGGITTLLCPPDSNPVIDSPAVVRLIRDRAQAAGNTRVGMLAAMTVGLDGDQLSGMYALAEAGCIAVTNLRRPLRDAHTLQRCLEYAASFDIPVVFQSCDPSLAAGGCVHEGTVSTRLGLQGIPASAETVAVSRDLLLVEQTGVRAHFGQLSTARAVELIGTARDRGLPVSADVAIHNLLLTESAVTGFNTQCHVIPPLREETDRVALVEGVRNGIVEAICSDHQPHENSAKHAPFAVSEPGASGLELLLSLGMKLVHDGELDLVTLVRALTAGPGRLAGGDSGRLEVGKAADICIFDPHASWRPEAESLRSAGLNTPFLGSELEGQVTHTLLAGRSVYTLG